MYFPEKPDILKGRGGSRLWNSEGMGGVTHFGISEGKGGLKHGSRPWLGMDIFWNCPIKHSARLLSAITIHGARV